MRMSSSALVVAGAASLGMGMRLESRAAQTSAICMSQFAWMQNTKGASPCQVTSSVNAVCNNGNWIVPALPANNSYNNPSPASGTASLCTCSWASYNLISACTVCQGIGQETPTWTVYSAQCAGFLSDTFFPSNITLPDGVAIPAWAQADPVTAWDGQTFNAFQAQQIADENKPDFVGGSSNGGTAPGHKSTNVGAIVGGVIGGLIVIASAALAAFWIIRRKQAAANAPSSSFRHQPAFSDAGSVVKMGNGSYAPMMSQPTSAPTINSSLRSFPAFGMMMEARPQIIPSHTPVPNHQQSSSHNGSSPENIIEPFTLAPTADNPDRKQALGSQPIYDHPSAPPPMRVDSTRAQTPRGRLNPPEYTPSSPGSVTSSLPRHAHKPSVDTQHSRSTSADMYGHGPSGSGMGNMNGLPAVQESSHGRNLSGESHDFKRADGNVMDYSASEIA